MLWPKEVVEMSSTEAHDENGSPNGEERHFLLENYFVLRVKNQAAQHTSTTNTSMKPNANDVPVR